MGTLRIDLPQDIIPLIVAELRHDIPALRAVSLVSRQWLYEAQRHLFARLTVNDARLERNYISFHRFVLANPIICSNIHVLRIMNHADWSALDLVELIIQLPNLHSLELDAIRFTPCATSALHERVRSLPKPLTIPFLQIKDCSSVEVNRTYDCMFNFIQAFSSIDVLWIKDPWSDGKEEEGEGTRDSACGRIPPKKVSVARLVYVVYEPGEVKDITALLLESIDKENLLCLGLLPWSDLFPDYQEALQSMLDGFTGIRHLQTELPENCGQGSSNPPSLALHHSLEVIEFVFVPPPKFGVRELSERKQNRSGGFQMLSSLASSRRFSPQQSPLSKVRVDVWLGNTRYYTDARIVKMIKDIPWSELATILGPFRGLKTVEVIYYTPRLIASVLSLDFRPSYPEDLTASLGSGSKENILDSTRSQIVGLVRRGCEVVVREESSKHGRPLWK